MDKVILNNEQDDRLYVKLEDPNGGFERSIDLPGGHYTNSFEIVQEVDTLLRNRSFVDPFCIKRINTNLEFSSVSKISNGVLIEDR